jgi:LmbE family N-acetylglucosaminyl deacetylase
VKFVSVTNGEAGHHKLRGPELVARRRAETQEVARRLGESVLALQSDKKGAM